MAAWPNFPTVCEINTWAWLNDLGRTVGRAFTLAEVPQEALDRLAGQGFDALWLMGVWQRSPMGREVARQHPDLQTGYRKALPDLSPLDVVGSPYAVRAYEVDPALGGDRALAELRERLARLGLRLVLDFVPNHLARDHPWVKEHPERLLRGQVAAVAVEPQNYFKIEEGEREWVFAHGRDPHFDGWTDTVQIDYRKPAAREAVRQMLISTVARCDGVRCDMAMLVMRDVFLRTWGGAFEPAGAEFWPDTIEAVKKIHPDFLMLAEAYWDLQWPLQQMGFDYTYDKRLYDRLLHGDGMSVQSHLMADFEYQRRLARFVENHDEERAESAFGPQRSRAAAVAALLLPGLRLIHDGQQAGARVRLPVQLGRRPVEDPVREIEGFYRRLLSALRHPVFRDGTWQLLHPRQAWPGNPGHSCFLAYQWTLREEFRLIVVNWGADGAQCFVPLGLPGLAGRSWVFHDLLNEARYAREGDDLIARGLYLDLSGWGYHLFDVRPAGG